jgi:WD40 repeat protein
MEGPCPTRGQLQRLLADPRDNVALSRHVEHCLSCQGVLRELTGSSVTLPRAPEVAAQPEATLDQRGRHARPARAPQPPAPAPRDQALPAVPGYELLEEVGRGGMGVIYKARHRGLGRIVALKMILAGPCADGRALARFRTEAEAVARLRHAHIVQVYDVGEVAGRPYLSLEFVEGGSLKERLTGRPFPAAQAARFILTVARAIDHAHGQGIVHRDLKPANVLLSAAPPACGLAFAAPDAPNAKPQAGVVPKITDFGVAKVLDATGSAGEQLTRTGDLLGTPSYMAPEQAGAAGEVGPTVDVYALGSILYELLTGRAPFAADSPLGTMMQLLHQEPVPVARLQPEVPRDLATITMKCLEKLPGKRYPGAGALADDLERFLDGRSIAARPVGRAERAWRWCRRNPVVAGLAAAVVLVFALGFGGTLWQMQQARSSASAESDARREAERQQGIAQQRENDANVQRNDALEQRRLTERAAALSRLDQGLNQCAGGDVALGMLLLADSLERVHRASALDLEHTVRCNLAAWSRHLPRLTSSPRHGTPVTAVAFQPDGKAVATATWGNREGQPGPAVVQFWEPSTWDQRGKPLEHPRPIWGLAFTPDSRTLATACWDGKVRLWDVASGTLRGTPLAHAAPVQAVAISPDGKTLAVGCLDGKAHVWDLASRTAAGPILEHQGRVLALAFSPDGEQVLTGAASGAARVWRWKSGKVRALHPHAEAVSAVAFSPDGRLVATGCVDHTARVWDLTTGRRLGPPILARYPVRAVAFHPTQPLLATGSGLREWGRFGLGEAQLWGTGTNQPIGPPMVAGGVVHALAWGPDGRHLLTGTEEGHGQLADVSRLLLARTIRHAPGVRQVGFDGTGRLFTVAAVTDRRAKEGEARRWGPTTGQPLGPPLIVQALPESTISEGTLAVGWSPDGRALLNGVGTDRWLVRDWATGRPLGPPAGQHWGVSGLHFSDDGRRFCSRLADGSLVVWDLAGNRQVGPRLRQPGGFVHTAWGPDGTVLLLAGGDGTTRLWDVAWGRFRVAPLVHPTGVRFVASRPDGTRFLTVDRQGTVRQWQTASGRPFGQAMPLGPGDASGVVASAGFAPGGRYVQVGRSDGVTLYDADTCREVGTLPPWPNWSPDGTLAGGLGLHGEREATWLWDARQRHLLGSLQVAAYHLRIHPGGKLVLTARESIARFWDAVTGRPIGPPLDHPLGIRSLAFRPDGRYLATCCNDEWARLWDVPAPVRGAPERLRLWIEVLTSKRLDEMGVPQVLKDEAVWERQQRLARLGGAPLP